MADDDLSTNSISGSPGIAFQAHTVNGDVYLNGSPPVTDLPQCEPPQSWEDTTELPAEIAHLLWAQEQAADLLPYQQLPGARTPSLGTVYVRQGLGGGVEEASPDHTRPALIPDEHGRLVEMPAVPSVRLTVRPPAKSMRSALDADPHLLVLGGPGQGKSTLTLRLTADIVRSWSVRSDDDAPLAEPVIPLRITARTLAQHLGSSFTRALADCAFAEYGRYLNGPLEPSFFAERVAGCRWLLLVDALDEVADSTVRATLVHTLSAWASRPQYRVLLTTRPTEGGALAALQRAGASRYELQPFDQEALRRFAHSWFEELGGDHADRFLHQVREAHLEELAEVPLLATIAAIVFEQFRDRPLPSNQFELYECYLEYIRRDHETAEAFDRYRVSLIEHLGRTRLATDGSLALAVHEWALRNDVQQVDALIAYLAHVGPFVQRGNDISFLHHSFAEHVAATSEARDLPAEFVAEHDDFAELLHTARPDESGRFARAVLLHYTHLHVAEADRLLGWLHAGGSDEHLLAARLLAQHVPTSAAAVREFLAIAQAWAMTTKHPALLILQQVSRATRHPGLIEWLAELMETDSAPWESRAEAAIALAVRLRCAHTDAAVAFLRSALDDSSIGVDDRLTAADALAHSGSSESEVAERGLRAVLDDPSASGADCRSAAVVLAAFEGDARAHAVAVLKTLVADEDTPAEDLVEAATGLLEIDIEFHDLAADVFLAVLQDTMHSVQGKRDATIGLASLGRRDAAAEALMAVFANRLTPARYRSDAASMLAVLGPQQRSLAGELLKSEVALSTTSTTDKIMFATELARIGHREFAVEVLRELLARPATSWDQVGSAASSLAALGPAFREEAARHFQEILDQLSPSGSDYALALRELAGLGEPHRSRAVTMMSILVADPTADAETRCTVASNLVRSAPELRADVVRDLLSITRTEQDRAVLCQAWQELRRLGPDLRGQAKQAMLALAAQDREGGEAPYELGVMFRWCSPADQMVAADVLRAAAVDESRGVRTRLAAVHGLFRLGRRFHRQAADLLCDLIAANVQMDLFFAVCRFAYAGAGRGVRARLAAALRDVLRDDRQSSAVAWSAVAALDEIGHRAADEDLRRIVADHSAKTDIRAHSALTLMSRGVDCSPSATSLVFRAADEMWNEEWHPHVARLAANGVDVRAQCLDVLADPQTPVDARLLVASLLGDDGRAVLRESAEDPYLTVSSRRLAYRLLAGIDSAALGEAVEFHRELMEDPDEQLHDRLMTAVLLLRVDRSFTKSTMSMLWHAVDALSLRENSRASAARRLRALVSSPSPRLVQAVLGLIRAPELDASLQHVLTGLLPRALRTAVERALLADGSSALALRVPDRDGWGDLPLCAEAEVVLRDVLTDPASTAGDRRKAAVELAELSAEYVPEAVGVLLSDGSPRALAEAAKLGEWQRVRDFVLDDTLPPRERRATALLLPGLVDDPAVREMLIEQKELSWRDRVEVLACLKHHDELRRLRDDRAGMPVQRCLAAVTLFDLTTADRAAGARLIREIAGDAAMRPVLRQVVADDLAELGSRGRAEAAVLLRTLGTDRRVSALARSRALNQARNNAPSNQAELVEVQREVAAASPPLVKATLLSSISWAPCWEAIEELLGIAADPRLAPRVRLLAARFAVDLRRDLKERCAVVAREIAFDADAPWHIRLKAAKLLGRWSEVMREDARALVLELRGL